MIDQSRKLPSGIVLPKFATLSKLVVLEVGIPVTTLLVKTTKINYKYSYGHTIVPFMFSVHRSYVECFFSKVCIHSKIQICV